MSQFGLLGPARLQPLPRLRRYNFLNKIVDMLLLENSVPHLYLIIIVS